MKLFEHCEIVRNIVRGVTMVVIVGDRAATPSELSALQSEFASSFGDAHQVSYFSRDGWQPLVAAAPAAEPSADAATKKHQRKGGV